MIMPVCIFAIRWLSCIVSLSRLLQHGVEQKRATPPRNYPAVNGHRCRKSRGAGATFARITHIESHGAPGLSFERPSRLSSNLFPRDFYPAIVALAPRCPHLALNLELQRFQATDRPVDGAKNIDILIGQVPQMRNGMQCDSTIGDEHGFLNGLLDGAGDTSTRGTRHSRRKRGVHPPIGEARRVRGA